MRFGLAMVVGALLAGEAQAAEQFDLVCKGELRKGYGAKPEPVDRHYRIDLAEGHWCEDDCTHVRTIVQVTPSRITFDDRDEPLKRGYALHFVERTTGEWHYSLGPAGDRWTIDGVCRPSAFTGINPQTSF
jgi:hypothetical protein